MDEDTQKKLSSFFKLLGGVMFGDIKKVEKILDQGVNVNSRLIDIDFDIERNIDSHPSIADTDTPLLVAVKTSANPEVIQLLLERGADASVKDENGKTPLEIAKERKLIDFDIVRILETHDSRE